MQEGRPVAAPVSEGEHRRQHEMEPAGSRAAPDRIVAQAEATELIAMDLTGLHSSSLGDRSIAFVRVTTFVTQTADIAVLVTTDRHTDSVAAVRVPVVRRM